MDSSHWHEGIKEDLHRFARSIARHEQEANDLVQDALVKALKTDGIAEWPDYRQRAWFFRVMKNRLIDERRREKRLTSWDSWEEQEVPLIAVSNNPVEMADLLARLPRELSDLVFKRYWLGLSSSEIGKQLDLPAATVRYKLQQAIRQLRKIMEAK